MSQIAGCKALVSRLHNLQEINMNFYFFEDNIFTLNQPEAFYLYNTNMSDTQTTEYIDNMSYKLFTVCTILLEKPYIQFQSESQFAGVVARNVNTYLGDFYEKLKKTEGKDKYKNPRARLIILDRSFDIVAPTQHDFSYQSLVYDTKVSPLSHTF